MDWIIKSILLGLGLAMDAFSVSLADGLSSPQMKRRTMVKIALIFAFFQGLMPLAGWICVHTVLEYFSALANLIPWIALGLLSFIGGKMLIGALKREKETQTVGATATFGLATLLLQGIATSIDALSVGFTIADYDIRQALGCVAVIAVVTFFVCLAGVLIGKRVGMKWSKGAEIFGGAILIGIGIEIILSHYFG